MVYAELLILSGLVLLVIGLLRGRGSGPQGHRPQRWKLLRDKPADISDVVYNPKEWRKPGK
jgi:hypothetical protein